MSTIWINWMRLNKMIALVCLTCRHSGTVSIAEGFAMKLTECPDQPHILHLWRFKPGLCIQIQVATPLS